jgi:hypothetical protein
MKYNEILAEAPMNPTQFGAAVTSGESAGVKVGFEFEVHVPRNVFRTEEKLTPNQFFRFLEDTSALYKDLTGSDGFTIQDFDEIFTPTSKFKYPSLQVAIDSKLTKVIEKATALGQQLSPEIMKQIGEKVTAPNVPGKLGNFLHLSRILNTKLKNVSKSDSKILGELEDLLKNFEYDFQYDSTTIEDAIIAILKTYEMTAKDWKKYFTVDIDKAMAKFKEDFDEWMNDDSGGEAAYKDAAKIIAKQIQPLTQNKVHVFQEYHEKKKNLNDWYIEPDGSLTPDNDSDASMEIVSPPLSAANAVSSLKGFYALAKSLGMYTNSTTGLHINVSIPQKLDVLKLALFLGDNHVLKTFGRENNDYADSVIKSLASQIPTEYSDLVDSMPFNKKIKELVSVANNITNDHTASISYNGKYVSFRHAGNDYLNNYEAIYNVLGRFVRAMMIASNPEMYKREYYTKLVSMINSGRPDPQLQNQPLNKVRQLIGSRGIPVMNVYGIIIRKVPDKKISKSINYQYSNYASFNTPAWTADLASVRSILKPALKDDQYHMHELNNAKNPVAFKMTGIPTNMDQLKRLVSNKEHSLNDINNSNWDTAAIILPVVEYLPLTDPVARQIYMNLMKNK